MSQLGRTIERSRLALGGTFAAGLVILAAGTTPVQAATWTVSNLNDTGAGSLRWAVQDATASPGADLILFDSTLAGTIVLTSGSLSPGGTMTIRGAGADRVAISGNDAARVLVIGTGTNVTVEDLTIRNGRSPFGTGSQGGGVQITAATATFNRCVFRDNVAAANTAAYGGAIYAMSGSTLRLEGCTLHANQAQANTFAAGGAIAAQSSNSVTLVNCTLTANHCQAGTVTYGGGLYLSGASATLEFCTIAANTLGAVFPDGGGIALGTGSSAMLGRTLLSGNAAGNCYRSGGTCVSSGFSLDSDGTTGFINGVNGDIVATGAAIDAKLGLLTDNGGPTPTMALSPGSPAIDAAIAALATLDQRGYPRVAEGNCVAPASADIGAYEYNAGRGVNFDAVDDYIDLNAGPEFNLANGFTLEAWVRADSLHNTSGVTRILSKRGAGNTGYGLGQTQNGKLLFTVFGRQDYVTTAAYIVPNQWTHVAVVFDTGNDASFYVNGQFVQSIAGNVAVSPNTAPLHIGRNPTSVDTQMWDGAIADVRIWNIIRTPSQIAGNYNAVLEGTEPGLLANFRLDEGTATTVFDAVSGGVAHLNGQPAWIAGTPCTCTRGDANCDGDVNFFDIDPFVMALFDRQAYETLFCEGSTCSLDMDCSGAVNFFDIDPFVEGLFGEAPPCP